MGIYIPCLIADSTKTHNYHDSIYKLNCSTPVLKVGLIAIEENLKSNNGMFSVDFERAHTIYVFEEKLLLIPLRLLLDIKILTISIFWIYCNP